MQQLLFRSWWVILIALLCYAGFERASALTRQQISSLKERVAQLERDIARTRDIRTDLQAQIASQSDPAWVSQILCKRLGVVPEGTVKVFFSERE